MNVSFFLEEPFLSTRRKLPEDRGHDETDMAI
jgi:hypothetical protein